VGKPIDFIVVRDFGLKSYHCVLDDMQRFTHMRTQDTADQIWYVQHPAVYTRGVSCHDLPWGEGRNLELVDSDRGGQITYHGPGQLIAYLLLDLRRCGLGVKELVDRLEQVIIQLLANYELNSDIRPGAPGVYINTKKIAALGLRIRNGCTYHGLSLNVDMDLTPFDFIDPCGYQGLGVTQLKSQGISVPLSIIQDKLTDLIVSSLGYSSIVVGLSTKN
tara:strand:- start:20 stop:676 length:657 start_codon:yes stop_codon:yes gene_type:complete